MSDIMEVSLNREAENVLTCRGCLAVRCRLYDICETHVERIFSDLTGLPVAGGVLCNTCLHLVCEFRAFRERCRNSDRVLNHNIIPVKEETPSTNSVHILNHMFLDSDKPPIDPMLSNPRLNEDRDDNNVDREIRASLSRSRVLRVNCESTRELATTDVLLISVPDEKDASEFENDVGCSYGPPGTVGNISKLKNLLNINDDVEDIEFHDVGTAAVTDNIDDKTELTDKCQNETDFMDVIEEDDTVETNKDGSDTNDDYTEPLDDTVETNKDGSNTNDDYTEPLDDTVETNKDGSNTDDDYTEPLDDTVETNKDGSDTDDDYTEPVKQKTVKKTKSIVEKDESEACKYFKDIWKAVSKANGDQYEMFERLYKFSLVEKRPKFPENVFRRKETKSELYNFIKFLDLYKKLADIHNVDIEFISITEERRTMDEKRKALAEDSEYCGMCFRKHVTAETMDRHKKLAHRETLPFRCQVCCYTFKRESFLVLHLLKFHTTRKKCRECNQSIAMYEPRSHWKEIADHMNKYHRSTNSTTPAACEFCGRTFSVAKHCFQHIRQVHFAEMNAVQCLLCGDSYNGPQGLRCHMNRIHSEAVRCTTCSVYFRNKEVMETHVAKAGHCQKDLSACPMCGATFPTKKIMKEHYDDTHANYKCSGCIQTFINYDSYSTHYNRICSGGLKLPKRQSDTSSTKKLKKYPKTDPRNNQFSKAQENTRLYVCSYCGKEFNVRAHMLYHISVHTGEKPYKCEYCDKAFRLTALLQLHVRTHTGERRYKCHLCCKAFRQHTHLTRHIRSHTQDKKYECDICHKRYMSRYTLTHHVQSVHEGVTLPPRRRKPKTKQEQ